MTYRSKITQRADFQTEISPYFPPQKSFIGHQ